MRLFLIDSVALQTSLIRTQEESWQALDAQKLPILTYLDNHHLNFCFSHSSRRQNAVFCWKLLALFWRHYQAAEPVFFGTRDFKLQKWLSYEKMQRNYLEKIESPLGGVIYTYILQHCETKELYNCDFYKWSPLGDKDTLKALYSRINGVFNVPC